MRGKELKIPSVSEVYNGGERSIVPEWEGWEFTFQGMIYLQHLFAYHFIRERCVNKKVLEVGCGVGYGAHLLSQVASTVTAIDLSQPAVQYASNRYSTENLEFGCVSVEEVAEDQAGSFDVIVAFQTIEHVPPHDLDSFIKSISKALGPSGVVFFTTPNRSRRLHFLEKPFNKYHFQEWTPWSFRRLCAKYFGSVRVQGITGSKLVMTAEWERGTRVKPTEYYLYSPYSPLYLARRLARRVVPFCIITAQRCYALARRSGALPFREKVRCTEPQVRTPWSPPRAFSIGDFSIQENPDWWCLDILAECYVPQGLHFN